MLSPSCTQVARVPLRSEQRWRSNDVRPCRGGNVIARCRGKVCYHEVMLPWHLLPYTACSSHENTPGRKPAYFGQHRSRQPPRREPST